jgi:DNA (cytosine-5)-methyltransferase 1
LQDILLQFAVGYANRLWKLLIDKRMTKTEMRKAAGISTNILAKMGKDEPVAMDTLAKIATALQCGLDDIVEIQNDAKKGENNGNKS